MSGNKNDISPDRNLNKIAQQDGHPIPPLPDVFSDSWKIGLDWRQATTESIPICYPFDDHLITTTGCPESIDLIPILSVLGNWGICK